MVDIDCIKTVACPVCGCHAVKMECVEADTGGTKPLRHANGGKWETREFFCGYQVCYIPNYRHEEVIHGCAFDPEIARQKEIKQQTKNEIVAIIEKSACSESYKERLKEAIKYT